MTYEVSGASTISGSDNESAVFQAALASFGVQLSHVVLVTLLTPGSNTFTAKYRAGGGTGTYMRRALTVIRSRSPPCLTAAPASR
jgi:hypothetical protein